LVRTSIVPVGTPDQIKDRTDRLTKAGEVDGNRPQPAGRQRAANRLRTLRHDIHLQPARTMLVRRGGSEIAAARAGQGKRNRIRRLPVP
jgi:hypothetical protein